MDLLRTLLIYMTMIFVSSVQIAPEPTIIPEPTTIIEATATPTLVPTPTPTPVPTPDITPNPAYRTHSVGDSGDAIKELQAKLAEYGYLTGEIDGRYGNETRRAVEQFQYANGLQVDGVAGRYTQTVLFESDSVRPAPTPTPDPNALTTAKPQADDTPIPISGTTTTPTATVSEPVSAPTDSPAPTDAPVTTAPVTTAPVTTAPADKSGETQGKSIGLLSADTDTDKSTDAPETDAPATDAPEADTPVTDAPATDAPPTDAPPTDAPATDAPETAAPDTIATTEFMPMQGYSISLAGSDEVLYAKADGETSDAAAEPVEPAAPVALEPCIIGVQVYVPLLRILQAANVLVIPNETLEINEYAFVLGEDIYRIDFTENQEGEPSGLEVYVNNEAQTLPVRDIRISQGEVFIPMESVESLTGIHFDMDDEKKLIIVTMP